MFKLYEDIEHTNINKMIDKKDEAGIKNKEILYDFLSGIAYHEFGHSKECPIDIDNFSIIFQAVSTCLEAQKRHNPELIYYIINLFSDFVINTVYGLEKENGFFRNSIFTYFFSELVLFNSSDTIFNLFVLLNLKTCLFNISFRDKIEDRLIKVLPKEFEKIIKEIIRLFCHNKGVIEKLWLGIEPTEDEKWSIINHITNTETWDSNAYNFTEIISKYIDKDKFNYDKISNDSIFTKKMREDSRFRKEVLKRIVKNKLDRREEIKKKTKKSSFMGLKKGDKDEKESKDNFEKYSGELSLEDGFTHFEREEILDAIYKYRLKKIKLNIKKIKKSGNYPLIWLNRREIQNNSNISNFDPLYTYFIPDSDEILLYEKRIPYAQDPDYNNENKGFPDLAIFCDDSGSMDWKIESGDGKYDSLIITLLSLMEWLKDKGFTSVIEYNFSFFSNSTRTTGWIDYFHLDEMKQFLYNPEGGQTVLDLEILENVLISKKDNLVIIISDGIIFNFKGLYKKIKDLVDKDKFLFIQIGIKSKLVNMLQNERFNVKVIKDISKLSIIILNFLEKSYNIN